LRPLANAMRAPSGDQLGVPSSDSDLKMMCRPEPSALATPRSPMGASPLCMLENAIRVPSGENAALAALRRKSVSPLPLAATERRSNA
jgi:hypothetical protein